MIDLLKRIHFWSCIVWRPVTGPAGNEPPMTAWQCWWAYGLDIRTAWEIAGVSWGPAEVRKALAKKEPAPATACDRREVAKEEPIHAQP